MAETRAVARALRFACNIDMTALEELGGDGADIPEVPTKSIKATPVKAAIKVPQPAVAAVGPNTEAALKSTPIKQVSLNVGRRPATAKLEVQNNNGEPNF